MSKKDIPYAIFLSILPVSVFFCHCQRSQFTCDFTPRSLLGGLEYQQEAE
jgi:hypothetical protein